MRITTEKQVGGKKKILAALGKYGISWLAAGAMSPTGRLLTKRHLSSGSFYSLLLNYWMVRGKNCWYSPADKNAAVCVRCAMRICSIHYVYTHISCQYRSVMLLLVRFVCFSVSEWQWVTALVHYFFFRQLPKQTKIQKVRAKNSMSLCVKLPQTSSLPAALK